MANGGNPVPFEIKVSSPRHHRIYLRIHQAKSQAGLRRPSHNAEKRNLGSGKEYQLQIRSGKLCSLFQMYAEDMSIKNIFDIKNIVMFRYLL